VALWLWMLVLAPLFAPAQEVSKDYQVKAVFLWRLAQFVSWPSSAFDDEHSPLVIGIIGRDPFGDALRLAVKDETAHSRPITVRHIDKLDEVRTCHILYVSSSEANRTRAILSAVDSRSILTVSDIGSFAENGGMVRLGHEQGKVKLTINPSAVRAAKLSLDARLLRVAEVVR
jgi:hypothetical protein